jgi:phenylpropionate dioxygenase-like ring-hydroxylating dioxygenase large terminal subunit
VDDGLSLRWAERRRQVARTLQRRLVAHLAAGGTTDFAAAPFTVDPAVYTDPVRANLEMRGLFLKLPLVAALSQDIAAPGDTLVFNECGVSIVLVRGQDSVLRGFLNMCTHRGTPLVNVGANGRCERRSRLTCPFHAWTFALDGALASVPGREGFDGIDLKQRGLVPVPVAEWHGIVFVRAAAGSESLDIDRHLGDFAPELAQLELSSSVPLKHGALKAATNWKLALDTYAEGYHFATLHASTIGVTHCSNIAVFDEFGPHWRIRFPTKALADLVGKPEGEWPDAEYEGIHFLFPNVILVIGAIAPGQTFARMFRLFPGATPGSMTCHIGAYVVRGIPAAEHHLFAQDDSASHVTHEDYQVAAGAYANLVNAPAGFKLVFGRNEIALQAFHRSIAGFLGLAG